MKHGRDPSLGEAVYYQDDAYAGVVRRLVVIATDSLLLIVLGISLWVSLLFWTWDAATGDLRWDPSGKFWIMWLGMTWGYLAIVKPSKWRTVGYRLTGLKIVDTRGQRPSVVRMTFRMLLWLYWPFNLLLDLMWLGADPEHQSLRDCYAGTYVVRAHAEPVGKGQVHLVYYDSFCLSLVYPRVVRPRQVAVAKEGRHQCH